MAKPGCIKPPGGEASGADSTFLAGQFLRPQKAQIERYRIRNDWGVNLGIRGAGGRGMSRKAAKPPRASKRNPYICIPMIEETPSDAKAGRNFWAVKRTGDYAFDCALGEGLARVTGHVIAREHLADTLRAVILNMVKQSEASGVEVGFLSTITRAAARGCQA